MYPLHPPENAAHAHEYYEGYFYPLLDHRFEIPPSSDLLIVTTFVRNEH
jgi:hypothetical protein